MFGSKNRFFYQKQTALSVARIRVRRVLIGKERSKFDIGEYLKAFDYFVLNPSQYDGATIVKDLIDVKINSEYLDLDAMLHDYEYIVKGANRSFSRKWKSDMKYLKNMERNGKGIRIPRMVLLTIAGVVFVPYKWLKNYYNEKFS